MKVVFDPYDALSGAHAAVVVTEWEEIRTLDLKRAAALMEDPKSSWTGATSWTSGRSGLPGSVTGASGRARAGAERQRALVTGGAGFLGSHLCERLLSEGYRVVCMDNLRTGSLENVAHLEGEAHFEYIDHDVTPT